MKSGRSTSIILAGVRNVVGCLWVDGVLNGVCKWLRGSGFLLMSVTSEDVTFLPNWDTYVFPGPAPCLYFLALHSASISSRVFLTAAWGRESSMFPLL